MQIDHHIMAQLKTLKLGGIAVTMENRIHQAQQSQLGYMEFLELIIQDEIERRASKKLALRLQRACFQEQKTIEEFDFGFNPTINAAQVRDLASCSFIPRHEHVLFVGPSGTGKSHLAEAIGHHACRFNYDVLFIHAVKLFRTLLASRADQSWEKRLKRFLRPDLLIIDDFCLRPLTPTQAEDFHEIVCARYLKGSMIITSNRPVEDWIAMFPDPILASSTMDRLAHHAHQVVIEGESYRKARGLRKSARKARKQNNAEKGMNP
jgi:DNA replication protein DnaC